MLCLALRLLTVVRMAGMVDSVKAEVAARTREAARVAGLLGMALILVVIGGVFVSVAAMLGLATVWPMHWAALAVGGALIAAAGVLLLLVRSPQTVRRSNPKPPLGVHSGQAPNAQAHTGTAGPPPDLDDILRPVETWVRQNPGTATLGAIAAGVVVGLLTGGKDSRKD